MRGSALQYQVGFSIPLNPVARELVLALFSAAGLDLSLLVEEEGRHERVLSFYLENKKKAFIFRESLRAISIRGGKFIDRVHRRKDWESRWKEGWKPFPLTRRFQIVPLWQESRICPPGKERIFLDTTRAFGTGLHETTRFTAQIIEDLLDEPGAQQKYHSFLDVGTGTGILAVVAFKCGIRRVVAFDIDPEAVKAARQNLKVNAARGILKKADVKDQGITERFDLVAANLVSPDLVLFRDHLLALVRPGGRLVISGISLSNLPKVQRAFRKAGVIPVRIRRGREWSAILF